MGAGVFSQQVRASKAKAAALDRADKQLLRGVGADVARQMTRSSEGLEAVGDGANVFAGPFGRLLGLEILLIGGVVVGGGGEQVGVAVLAGGGVGLHVAGEFIGA